MCIRDSVVSVAAETALEQRVAFELAGFRVLSKPVTVEELLDKGAELAGEARA